MSSNPGDRQKLGRVLAWATVILSALLAAPAMWIIFTSEAMYNLVTGR